MVAHVAWISFAPVKGLRLQHRDEVELDESGVPGDRAFFVVDERGVMVSASRLGPLVAVVPEHDAQAQTLSLRFPGGEEAAGRVELGEPESVRFYGLGLRVRPVRGPFSEALSRHCGRELRLVAAPPERPGVDRGRDGAATLVSVASLERLRVQAAAPEPVDPRRFRMTFGVDGLDAHEEDGWINRDVRVGDALLRVSGNVGRCALTTRQPETGVVDFKTLHHLQEYRGDVPTTEPLPFGVHARVLRPGRVRVGDTVALAGP
ncbi:MAG: MOSC domain-containing protein [Chloroflexota bacterium]|nr:MOSC domain-containing protein [Chloroflexota bacterium]